MSRFIVVGFEKNRYDGGFVVKDKNAPWGIFEAEFDGSSKAVRERAQNLADKLNAMGEMKCSGKSSAK